MNTTTLADGTYSYARPAMWGKEDAITAIVQGGQFVAGTLNGQPMTGYCWKGCTLADLGNLPHVFTPAAPPIGKARAFRMHKALAAAGYCSEHCAMASGVLGREVCHLRELSEAEARTIWFVLTQTVAA